jgi:hypothetical protein
VCGSVSDDLSIFKKFSEGAVLCKMECVRWEVTTCK